MKRSAPILVLDSGLGGLTVARALRAALPMEDLIYFGDTARLPYGNKSAATVTAFVDQIIEYCRPFNPKHVVIACNTATALALSTVAARFPELSISGVIEPGAKAAVVAAGAKARPTIGIIATEATIRSKAYDRAIHRRRHHAILLLQPAPLLVPIVEEGRRLNDPLSALAVEQYLRPMLNRGIDVLVLGCTHYPILRPLIESVAGSDVLVIDSAEQCAQDVARRLRAKNLLRTPDVAAVGDDVDSSFSDAGNRSPAANLACGTLRCFITDDSPRFALLASRFLGFDVDSPTCVSTDDLYAQPGPALRQLAAPKRVAITPALGLRRPA